jgi:ribosomal protein S1
MDTNNNEPTVETTTTAPAPQPEAAQAAPAAAEPAASGESMAEHLSAFSSLAPGNFVRGRVTRVDKEGVMVDVGYKSDGLIKISELSHRFVNDPNEIVKVGDEIDVVVLKLEDAEGTLLLSKKRADSDSAWKTVIDAHESGATLTATAIEQVKGGLIVDLGLRGFLPASQVDLRPVKDLGDYVGEPLQLKVIEIDRGRRKVVLSRKKALEEERTKAKQSTMTDLNEGQIIQGTVARLTNFGAFINLGGVDGLVHISELSSRRIKHPSEVVRIGETVDVLVLKVDKKKERISLSLRQARPDPWLTIGEQFKEGQIVKGTISKIFKNYVFVELAEGVEGVMHISELSHERVNKAEDVVQPGLETELKVLAVKPQVRRIELSIKALKEATPSEYRSERGTGQFTMAQLLKDKFQERGITSVQEHLKETRGDKPETGSTAETAETAEPAAAEPHAPGVEEKPGEPVKPTEKPAEKPTEPTPEAPSDETKGGAPEAAEHTQTV